MPRHPAFWPLEQTDDGRTRGLWHGQETWSDSDPLISAAGPDDGPAAVVTPAGTVAALGAAGANLSAVLRRELERTAPAGAKALTELAQVMIGLPRHAALAASDAPDRPLAEGLTKLSIHWTRVADGWRDLIRHLTGLDSEQLQPLPTTLALQLCLEELASRDVLGYVAAARTFGFPGDETTVNAVRDAASGLLGMADPDADALIGQWAERAARGDENYSSVRSLRAMGSLQGVDLLRLAADTEGPMSVKRWRRTLGEVQQVAETVTLFGFGVVHFYQEADEPWPRRRMAWAGV